MPSTAHPSDVTALAEGVTEAPRRGIWKTVLSNILRNHKWKKGVPKRHLLTLLQYVEEDIGGDVDESTQEGEETACGLIKEAVLRQMLQHLLAVHSDEAGEDVILLAEEQLETLQALLEAASPGENWHPPLTRNTGGPRDTPAAIPEAGGTPGKDQYGLENVSRPLGASDEGNQEALYVVAQFTRRHALETHFVYPPASSMLRWG